MPRVLVLSLDPTGPRMGGAAVRATGLARALAAHFDVTLAAPGTAPDGSFAFCGWDPLDAGSASTVMHGFDVIVTPPQSPVAARALARSGARVALDLYDPMVLAVLEAHRGASPAVRRMRALTARDALTGTLRVAHHAICASERQRDLWLGVLVGLGLLGPAVYDEDPSLRSRLDVVPIGASGDPLPEGHPLRERFGDVPVVLWFGGLWNWLDPVTAVRAFGRLRETHEAQMVVVGKPPADIAERATADAARRVAGDGVHWVDELVPYAERGAWLRDAAVAISTHHDHVETRFAFRTRILDYLWAGLPVVCTAGDDLSELVARERCGVAVAPGDVDGAAAALAAVLDGDREAYAARCREVAAGLGWDRAVTALVRMLGEPSPAPFGAAALTPPAERARGVATRALRRFSR